MINDKKMTDAEIDAWLYSELDKTAQKAWRMMYGLPKLLRVNHSADKGHDAGGDNDNPSADCNFKK